MPRHIPGQTESAFIGYAVVSALLDVLVAKRIITDGDVDALFRSVAKTLSDSGDMLQKRGAQFIAERVLPQK